MLATFPMRGKHFDFSPSRHPERSITVLSLWLLFAKFAWFIVMQDMRRIEWEKRTVRHMIELWCRGKHGGNTLCDECQTLLDYSLARLEHCRFGEKKTKCHKCAVHCYKPEMRARIREVMRYSGPRMILYHPLEALRYLISR